MRSRSLERCTNLGTASLLTASLLAAALLGAGPLAPARAQVPETPAAVRGAGVVEDGVRKSVYSVGLSGYRHSLKAGDGNEMLGNAAAIQLGAGYVSEAWYFLSTLDILLGPYERVLGGQLNVDYVGTGLTLWSGFSAQGMDLRSPEGGYGFALGLSYADAVGRSLGKNRHESREDPARNATLVDNYQIRVTSLALVPGIFFSWLAPPRPRGNTPELLATRLEGYILNLGMAIPLLANYSTRSETRSGEVSEERGRLRGYNIVVSLTAPLGI